MAPPFWRHNMGKVLRIYPGTADVETFMRQVVTQMIEEGDEPDGLAIIIKQKRGKKPAKK